jgi:hypothetical protein
MVAATQALAITYLAIAIAFTISSPKIHSKFARR